MKKRSACKILLVIVAMGYLSVGECGRVTLQGSSRLSTSGNLVIYGMGSSDPDEVYRLSISCVVCESYTGPCVGQRPSNMHVGARSNVRDLTMEHINNGVGYAGDYMVWKAARPGADAWVSVDYRCDNAARPDWTWVHPSFHGYRRDTGGALYVVGTNYGTGETLSYYMGRGGAWSPWKSVRPGDGTTGPVSVGVSYPDRVVLRGKGSSARVLYDVTGNAPVYARIEKMPRGLKCARSSDGLRIEATVSAAVGAGDSIMCTNVQVTPSETTGELSITTMVR